jgi:alkylation response protein AidB-like acyl-CoA dehydrogenase
MVSKAVVKTATMTEPSANSSVPSEKAKAASASGSGRVTGNDARGSGGGVAAHCGFECVSRFWYVLDGWRRRRTCGCV